MRTPNRSLAVVTTGWWSWARGPTSMCISALRRHMGPTHSRTAGTPLRRRPVPPVLPGCWWWERVLVVGASASSSCFENRSEPSPVFLVLPWSFFFTVSGHHRGFAIAPQRYSSRQNPRRRKVYHEDTGDAGNIRVPPSGASTLYGQYKMVLISYRNYLCTVVVHHVHPNTSTRNSLHTWERVDETKQG